MSDQIATDTDLAKQQAFVAPPDTVAGLTLNPLSAGTLILLKQTHNPLIEGAENPPDVEFHVAAFLYLLTQSGETVIKVSADPVAFRTAVLQFANTLSVADFIQAAQQIKTIIERAVVGHDYEVKTDASNPSPNF